MTNPLAKTDLISKPLRFSCGVLMKNRFMLAPMTNRQSHQDGRLSDDEFQWLTLRAKGGFGLTMTCAAHVQETGKGFSNQLGIFSDALIPGHQRLTKEIKRYGSLAVIQLHHAGARSPVELIGERPVCPSEDKETNARSLSLEEVCQLRDDFISAAVRSQVAGYDGVEIHGAHGYVLCQFLSSKYNRRQDHYGGSLRNRARIIFEILEGVRSACGPQFLLGLRLSPEHHGIVLSECMEISQRFIDSGLIDFLDVSLWDVFKQPAGASQGDKTLLEHVVGLNRRGVKLTVAGKISTAEDVRRVMSSGIDFVTIGRAAILHHDYPLKVMKDSEFVPVSLPVSEAHLIKEGLSTAFVNYMKRWKDFVQS